MPLSPEFSRWEFPPASSADDHGLVAVGADLQPGTLLRAYKAGMFPMPLGRTDKLGWWSPDPRAIIPLDALRVTRSLRRSLRRYRITADVAFAEVVEACRNIERPHGWISSAVRDAYIRLHRLGWAHSVEAWSEEGELVGGLYGVSVGGLFAGESMFHIDRDASKVALVSLVGRLAYGGVQRLLDVQWATEHLRSLGAIEIDRSEYLKHLELALRQSPAPWPR
ncbi:MAG: leucyl/phenylalanyl-tRNA--protein transferase [Acidimicrobiia bacterium]|nr:leucyl/phenylalanyl-tRNA--protein transferase [Acidimicrobiia bacterium]MYC57585.1 leucyl/phenylalanyl-tRNA--protein transferase [Acidimicrobiia bacterium]MYG94875.1 leucyl/phenylalanyl-tRNA--protein transferase [Acidimicrobiia bacterium]MYI31284.1 leucyl/phenylalanyl-tRNA--protein transferase [Acidimicrobiia bacterium]